jgi:hypothetical protein
VAYQNINLFLIVLETEKSKIKAVRFGVWGGPAFWLIDGMFASV